MIAGRFQELSDTATYAHAKAITENHHFGPIGFFDRHRDRSASMAKRYSGRSFAVLADMLLEMRPSVVAICSSDQSHFDYVINLLRSPQCPRVIFVEKPVCDTQERLDMLLAAQMRNSKTSIFVNHSRRFDAMHQKIAGIIGQQRYGSLHYCRIDYYGGWLHNGIHLVDLFDMFFASSLDATRAECACESKSLGDQTLHVEGRLAGADIYIRGHREENFQITDVDLFFEQGRILISDFGQEIECFRRTVNAANETVLMRDEELCGVAMFDQMPSAYREISRQLDGEHSAILESVSLQRAAKIMKSLWKVREQYEQSNS